MSIDQLPLKEWIIIFYPQTGSARLCPTFDFAKTIAGSTHTVNKHVYRSPKDFRTRHDHHQLEECWKLAYKTASWMFPKTAVGSIEDYSSEPPDCGTEKFVELLWEFLQDVGDRLTKPRDQVMGKPKENYQLRLQMMSDAVDSGKLKEMYNKQASTVFIALLENGKEFLNEEEIKKLIYNLVATRALKTKQEPWVIFQYYRPQFIKDGFVLRGGKPRKSRNDNDGDEY